MIVKSNFGFETLYSRLTQSNSAQVEEISSDEEENPELTEEQSKAQNQEKINE